MNVTSFNSNQQETGIIPINRTNSECGQRKTFDKMIYILLFLYMSVFLDQHMIFVYLIYFYTIYSEISS